jgi:hypothetical protein
MHQIEVKISASIPDGDSELGHEAIVATKAPVQEVVDAMSKLGLVNITQKRRLHVRRPRDAKTPAEATAEE